MTTFPPDHMRFPHESEENISESPAAHFADAAGHRATSAGATELPSLWAEVRARASRRGRRLPQAFLPGGPVRSVRAAETVRAGAKGGPA